MNIALVPPWVLTGLAAVVALALTLTAYRLVFAAAHRLTAEKPLAYQIVAICEDPARLFICLIVLQAVWHSAPDAQFHIGIVRHLTTLALIGAATWLLVRCIGAAGAMVAFIYPANVADNLYARRVATQMRVLTRTLSSLTVAIGLAFALMTFPDVRHIGASVLASAGIAGVVIGFAAKPVLGNLIAGMQIAISQPIRIDDVVIVEGEWGRIEEITGSYVVVCIWDERRLVVPLQWFVEKPFENWTRTSGQIIGTVLLWIDYRMPLEPLRAELLRVCKSAAEWDQRVCVIQVTDASEQAMQVRALVSSADAGRNWDLRCLVRERLIAYVQQQFPEFLPRSRAELAVELESAPARAGRAVHVRR